VCLNFPLIRFSNRLPVRAWPPLSGHHTAGTSIPYRIQGKTTVLLRYKTGSSRVQGRFISAFARRTKFPTNICICCVNIYVMVWRSCLDWKWRTSWSRQHKQTWVATSHVCQNAKIWMLWLSHLYTELILLWYLRLTSCLSAHNCRIKSRNRSPFFYTESK